MTGIELTGDSCIVVDVRRAEGVTRLERALVLAPGDWVGGRLSRSRRKGFGSRAWVVSWSPDDALLAPLRRAGFSVERVLTPEEALALLASQRGNGGATAWLAISRQAGVILIARGAEVLHARRVAWKYKDSEKLNEQLLQRYLLVSHLAPQLEHAIERARAEHGVEVQGAVTCGDLPDLRSLTMPLIEELDLEVETLDSLDGLEISEAAAAAGVSDAAPGLHLAAAVAAAAPEEAPRGNGWWGRAAAAFAVLAVAAGGWWLSASLRGGDENRVTDSAITPAPVPGPTIAAGPVESRDLPASAAAREIPTAAETAGPARPPAAPAEPSGAATGTPEIAPHRPGRAMVTPAPAATAGSSTETEPQAVPLIPAPADAGHTSSSPAEPLPSVSSILYGTGRRLAIVDGTIRAEGEAIGPRRLVRIERDAVVLRESGGAEVRVPVRRVKHAS